MHPEVAHGTGRAESSRRRAENEKSGYEYTRP